MRQADERSTASPLDLRQIQEYVWARYVNHDAPARQVDEDEALLFLETHYATHPMTADAECFYYGILAFERSFARPERRRGLLERALAAFQAYHYQTNPHFAWEAVEDRYQETLDGLGVRQEAR